jgi:spermidine synthase
MKRRRLLLLAFFLTGACGLVYEMAWVRRLSYVFGSTTLAISTVLAAFMAGLALGSLFFGKLADRRPSSALRVYGALEVGIGVLALLMPLLFRGAASVYLTFYPTLAALPAVFFIAQFLLAGCVILLPTLLMGGSLPLLTKGLVARKEELSGRLGALYAANTVGAGAGTAIATYALLPSAGVLATERLAAALNVLVGAAVLVACREPGRAGAAMEPARSVRVPATRTLDLVRGPLPPRALALLIGTAASGFAAMAGEVAWARLFALVLGSSVYVFGMIVLVFLVGMSLGSALFARIRRWRPIDVFATASLANGVWGTVTIALVPVLPAVFLRDFPSVRGSFLLQQLQQLFLVSLVLLPAAILFGLAFPAAIAATTSGVEKLGIGIGRITLWNTAGTVGGAFLTGFLLIPWIGLRAALVAGLAATTAMGLVVAWPAPWRRVAAVSGGLALAGALFLPSWPREIMVSGAGFYATLHDPPEKLLEEARKMDLLFYKDGVSTTLSVDRQQDYRYYRSNGKTDASTAPGDMANQLLLGHLPMLLHASPHDVFILGMGTGVTAGAVARYPVKTIEIVDIEPASRDAAALFEPENRGVLGDPRTRFLVVDGRNALLARSKTFDVIISDPSDVWVAGVGNLFTREFYELARSRLRPGGVVVQWFHTHALPLELMKLIVATFRSVFPDASYWRPNRGDIILVGTTGGVSWDFPRLRERYETVPGVKEDLKGAGLWSPLSVFSAFVVDGKELGSMLDDVKQIHTDDRPLVEFLAPRALYADTTETNDPAVQRYQHRDTPELKGFEPERDLDAREIYLFGFGYASLGRTDLAIRKMEESIRREPAGDPKFRVGLANQYRVRGDKEKASALYRSVLLRTPGDAEAALGLNELLKEAGKDDEAVAVLVRAARAAPEDAALRDAAASAQAGASPAAAGR